MVDKLLDKKILKDASAAVRKDTTLKLWALKKGFHPDTVVKFLCGFSGKRQLGVSGEIIAALRADGYLK